MSTGYFEATGEAKKTIDEFFKLRKEGSDKVLEFCKQFPGADPHNISVGIWHGEILSIRFTAEPNKNLWVKSKRYSRHYRPRMNTPEGKQLAKELDAIRIPSSAWVKEKFTRHIFSTMENPGVYGFSKIGRTFIEGTVKLYAKVPGLVEVKASEFHKAKEDEEEAKAGK